MADQKQEYTTPDFGKKIDLALNANESCPAIPDLAGFLGSLETDVSRRYPDHRQLQSELGSWLNLDEKRIVLTAGGDESIDRVVREYVQGKRNQIVTHAPTFDMVRIYADNYGGIIKNTPWIDGEFPVEAILQAIGNETAIVVLTTPNNPTGRTIPLSSILEIAKQAQNHGAVVLADLAYIEFAEVDITKQLADIPGLMMVRTFSKAWGLAGLRVGYLVAPDADTAKTIRAAAGPYPVSGVSLATALCSLRQHANDMQSNLERIKRIRNWMHQLIEACGGRPLPSEANFILAAFDNTDEVWSRLADDGIGVRKWIDHPVLANYLRIGCPTNEGDFIRLVNALCKIAEIDAETYRSSIMQEVRPDLAETNPTPSEPGNDQDKSWTVPTWDGPRTSRLKRETKETKIELAINLDGTSRDVKIETGIGFLDHMLTALAFHGGMDLHLKCIGDLHVDDHHTAEDCALALGTAIDQALGPRKGIKRFGYAYAPLDEALARTVIDLSGRPWPEIHLHLERPMVGTWACENITHFFQSLAMTLKCSLHVDVLRGTNDHHRAEAAFKSLAKAIKEALTQTEGDVPSTKGVL